MSEYFSITLGGPLTLGGIFQKPGWNFPQPWMEFSCLPPPVVGPLPWGADNRTDALRTDPPTDRPFNG